MVDGCVKAIPALFGWLPGLFVLMIKRSAAIAADFSTFARFPSETSVDSAAVFIPKFIACNRIPVFAVATGTVSTVQPTSSFPHRLPPSLGYPFASPSALLRTLSPLS